MNDSELTMVVREHLDGEIASGNKEISKAWLVHAIVSVRPAKGDHSDFHMACAYHAVSEIVGRVIRQFGNSQKEEDESRRQLVLAGYERVQTHYSVDRDGPCVVAIELCTRDELMKKASELRSMATGLTKHADELESFIATKFDNAAE